MDAFPDYTRWNKKKKVFASLQVIGLGEATTELERLGTSHDNTSAIEVATGANGVGGVKNATTANSAYTTLHADKIEPRV